MSSFLWYFIEMQGTEQSCPTCFYLPLTCFVFVDFTDYKVSMLVLLLFIDTLFLF